MTVDKSLITVNAGVAGVVVENIVEVLKYESLYWTYIVSGSSESMLRAACLTAALVGPSSVVSDLVNGFLSLDAARDRGFETFSLTLPSP